MDLRVTDEQLLDAYKRHGGSTVLIARELGITDRRTRQRLRELGVPPGKKPVVSPMSRNPAPPPPLEFAVPPIPDDDIDVESLVEHRIKQFKRKAVAHAATRLIPVKVKIPGPIGLLVFGDPMWTTTGRTSRLCACTPT